MSAIEQARSSFATVERQVLSESVCAPAARSAHRAPGEQMLTRRDIEVLRWLGEQYAGRQDHLEVLLGCGERQTRRVIARLRAHKLVRVERFLAVEPAWVTPTNRGLDLAGSEFRVWRANLRLLAHLAAVNDVRLHIERRSAESVWRCERDLAREQGIKGHLPDALITLEGREIAVEVELTLKSKRRLLTIVNDLTARYDTILYFCAPTPHAALTKIANTGRWPGLGIRELPTLGSES